jgi:hypothetical protein
LPQRQGVGLLTSEDYYKVISFNKMSFSVLLWYLWQGSLFLKL